MTTDCSLFIEREEGIEQGKILDVRDSQVRGEAFRLLQERKKLIVARNDEQLEKQFTKMMGRIGLNVKSSSLLGSIGANPVHNIPNVCAKVITFFISSLVSSGLFEDEGSREKTVDFFTKVVGKSIGESVSQMIRSYRADKKSCRTTTHQVKRQIGRQSINFLRSFRKLCAVLVQEASEEERKVIVNISNIVYSLRKICLVVKQGSACLSRPEASGKVHRRVSFPND